MGAGMRGQLPNGTTIYSYTTDRVRQFDYSTTHQSENWRSCY